MAEPLTIDDSVDDDVVVLRLDGDITSESEDVLTEAYDRASDIATAAVVLDFTDVEYMNSGGIGLLVTLLVRAESRGHRLVAFGLTEHYWQIFELTRLDEMIEISASEEEAMSRARSASAATLR